MLVLVLVFVLVAEDQEMELMYGIKAFGTSVKAQGHRSVGTGLCLSREKRKKAKPFPRAGNA